MKTRELIRQLQECDPSGEIECCVGNVDIHFVSREMAGWDGALQVLDRDEMRSGYNITGARYRVKGNKIQIHELSIESVLWEDPKAPVDYSELGNAAHYRDRDDETRRQSIKCDVEIERKAFVEFVQKQMGKPKDPWAKDAAEAFYNENLTPQDEMPEDLKRAPGSWNDRREEKWSREISIVTYGYAIMISRR